MQNIIPLWLGSIFLFLLSLLLPPFSVHTYCETWIFGVALGIAQAFLLSSLLRPREELRKLGLLMKWAAVTLSSLGVLANIVFVGFAIQTCTTQQYQVSTCRFSV